MLIKIMSCTVLLLAATLPGPSVGVPGINDFTLNGQGSGSVSPFSLTLLTGPAMLDFQVTPSTGTVWIDTFEMNP